MHQNALGALCVVLLSVQVWAQGAGMIGPAGIEPTLQISPRVAGQPSALFVDGLEPSTTANLQIVLSHGPGHMDLAPFGAPEAALGIAMAPTPTFLPLLPVPVTGQVTIPFVPDPALVGFSVYLQAAQLEPSGPAGLLNLSDARVVTFAQTDSRMVVSVGPSPVSQDLAVLFTDGSAAGPTLPALTGIEILDVSINARADTMHGDCALPVLDESVPQRTRVRTPGGHDLYHYRDAAGQFGFFLADQSNGAMKHLVSQPGVAGANPFASDLAVSAFAPLAAVLTEDNGLAEILLLRTDGSNHPGSASPVMEVCFSGTLAGFAPQEISLTFLDGALFCSDGTQLVRISTTPGTAPQPVPLDPSGGLVPTEMDDEFACAADGSALAFTAGASGLMRDVYLVSSAPGASALNLTHSPGSYEEVGYRDLTDGGRLALAPDGSRIAYVKEIAASPEVFVMDATPGAPATHLTPDSIFVSTIDQEVVIHFFDPDKLAFSAGTTGTTHDVYNVQLNSGNTTNVSLTGTPVTPFTEGGLRVSSFATSTANGVVYVMENPSGARRPIALAANGAVLLDLGATATEVILSPAGSSTLLAANSATGTTLHRLTASGSSAMPQASGPVVSMTADPSGDGVAVVATSAGQQLQMLPGAGGVVAGPVAASWSGGMGRTPSGQWLAASSSPTQASIVAVEPSGTPATIMSSPGTSFVY